MNNSRNVVLAAALMAVSPWAAAQPAGNFQKVSQGKDGSVHIITAESTQQTGAQDSAELARRKPRLPTAVGDAQASRGGPAARTRPEGQDEPMAIPSTIDPTPPASDKKTQSK